jgi:biopolymer transport protein ExbB
MPGGSILRTRLRSILNTTEAPMERSLRRAALAGLFALAVALAFSAPLHAQDATAPAATPVQVAPPLADLSLSAMVHHADGVVQGVMAGLAAASVLCWTILLAKGIELLLADRAVRRSLSLAERDAPQRDAPRPLRLMRLAVQDEIEASADAPVAGTKERLASRLHRIELRLARQAQRGTGLLATIGSVGPFVGLFGTVWGIMNSFIGIAKLHTTNLAVVAPGIAEALLATATGLVAAIPAVVIYNVFARWVAGYRHHLADLGEIVLRHAARGLDRRAPARVTALAAE